MPQDSKIQKIINNNKAEIKAVQEVHGLYDESKAVWRSKFARIGYFDLYTPIGKTKEYLFFTRPNLNLCKDQNGTLDDAIIANSPFIREVHMKHRDIVVALCNNVRSVFNSPFIPILTNACRNTLDLPNIQAKDEEFGANQFGTKIYFQGHSFDSDENHDFTLEFEDTRYLEVYNMFKVMTEYNNLKKLGLVKPKHNYFVSGNPKARRPTLYDQIAIFKITVAEDGETILSYAKAIGTYSKGAPREALSEIKEGIIYSVNFKANFIEDNNPVILEEFNNLVEMCMFGKMNPKQMEETREEDPTKDYLYSGPWRNIEMYDTKRGMPTSEWADLPYITRVRDISGRATHVFKLRWAKRV